jgi:probable rRNA maturation factor
LRRGPHGPLFVFLEAVAGEGVIVVRRQIRGVDKPALARFVSSVRRSVKLNGEVTVLVTNNAEMKELNDHFRNKNKATDVLSFIAAPHPGMTGYAGDLAISAEMARENAKALGHTVLEEIKVLALHGILHLAGYDHETDSGEMSAREQRLRKKFRLPYSLIERNNENNPRPKKVSGAEGTALAPGKTRLKRPKRRLQ